jgi:hypothetical protein
MQSHFTIAIQKCLLTLVELATIKWNIADDDIQLIQFNLMKIAKFCMLNELEISTVLYLFRQNDARTSNHKSKVCMQEKWQLLQGLYYLVLYVKESLSEPEYFKDLLEGQKTFDLYSVNYDDWKKMKNYNLDYFKIDLKSISTLKKINEEMSSNLRLKNKQNSGHLENMNDLVKRIIMTSNPKGNHYGATKFEENDPMRFANSLNADVKGLCESYEHNVLQTVTKVNSIACEFIQPDHTPQMTLLAAPSEQEREPRNSSIMPFPCDSIYPSMFQVHPSFMRQDMSETPLNDNQSSILKIYSSHNYNQ